METEIFALEDEIHWQIYNTYNKFVIAKKCARDLRKAKYEENETSMKDEKRIEVCYIKKNSFRKQKGNKKRKRFTTVSFLLVYFALSPYK